MEVITRGLTADLQVLQKIAARKKKGVVRNVYAA